MASVRTLGEQLGLSHETLREAHEAQIRHLRGLGERLSDRLVRQGIRTVGELAGCADSELLAIPFFGQGTLDKVKGALARLAVGEHRRTLAEQLGIPEETVRDAHDTPVEDLPGLSPRMPEHLVLIGIRTVDKLAYSKESELLGVHGFGCRSLEKAKTALVRFAQGERATSSSGRAATAPGPTQRRLAAWLEAYPSLPRELTLQEIGATLGVSRERARQMLNKLGVSERKGLYAEHIDEGHPGYGAYMRALSRGASESTARTRARNVKSLYIRMQDSEYRERDLARRREQERTRHHEKRAYWASHPGDYQERQDRIRERQRRRYREDPAYRARVRDHHRRYRARRRERGMVGQGATYGRSIAPHSLWATLETKRLNKGTGKHEG